MCLCVSPSVYVCSVCLCAQLCVHSPTTEGIIAKTDHHVSDAEGGGLHAEQASLHHASSRDQGIARGAQT